MITLIQGGHLYGPEDLGSKDLLVINGKIERIADAIAVPGDFLPGAEVVQAGGKLVLPGFIDHHVHTIGGGGSGGPLTRVKEVFFRDIVKSGITTLVGTLGSDAISRSLATLLTKSKALSLCGLHSFIYTGSILFPPATITGSVEKDIALISEVMGRQNRPGGNGLSPSRPPRFGKPDQRNEAGRIAQRQKDGGSHPLSRVRPEVDRGHRVHPGRPGISLYPGPLDPCKPDSQALRAVPGLRPKGRTDRRDHLHPSARAA